MQDVRTRSGTVSATALSTFEIFAALSQTDRADIAQIMRMRTYPAGSYIISATRQQTDVYFLVSGKVRVCAFSKTGKQIHFDQLTAGMMFGELAAIDHGERSCDCIAMETSRLAVLTGEDFLKVVENYPQVQRAVLQRLVGMLRSQMQRVYEFTSFSVSQRVRFELLRLASDAGSDSMPIVIDQPPTHADLAARISSHREAVTRELKKLELTGLITWRPGKYLIHDIGGLTKLAGA